jgi:hypothetical protein
MATVLTACLKFVVPVWLLRGMLALVSRGGQDRIRGGFVHRVLGGSCTSFLQAWELVHEDRRGALLRASTPAIMESTGVFLIELTSSPFSV